MCLSLIFTWPVDVLDLVDQVVGQRFDPEHGNIVRHGVALEQQIALAEVTFLNGKVCPWGSCTRRIGAFLLGTDDNAALAL